MNRWLHYLNALGVLALATLCVAQWQRDRRLNLEIHRLEQTRLAHEQKLTESENAERLLRDDFARFKEALANTQKDFTEQHEQLRSVQQENRQLRNERDQLKESVTNWTHAVALRDERLKEANERITNLAAQLEAAVQKFNRLATNYNDVVARFNELATNYDGAVKELKSLGAKVAGAGQAD